mmetsp:Transcript_2734/g.3956  ORF Transcript_2734/g.3956 Transcript_2734/m.3956 type:complete len:296 (+) Transcript_2734:133-1020(+)
MFLSAHGRHKPACGGICLLADVGSMNLMPLSAGLIIVPCTLWFAFVGPQLAVHFKGGFVFIFLVAITMTTALTWLFLAWSTEPGIIPHVAVEETESEKKALMEDKAADGHTTLRRNPKKRRRFMIQLNGQNYPLPLFRAKICRETEACVERFDHFCPWVGNVVGLRNHRYFVLFTITTSIVAFEVFVTSLLVGATALSRKVRVHERAVSLALMSYTAVILLAVGGLMFYHIDLIATNESTNERLKGVYALRRNPHNKGTYQNCYDFWCLPLRKSYVGSENKDDDVPLPLLPAENV